MCLLLSTNGSGHSNPLVNQTFKSGSHEGRYFYQQGRSFLVLFCLHMQLFTGIIAYLIGSGQKCEEN